MSWRQIKPTVFTYAFLGLTGFALLPALVLGVVQSRRWEAVERTRTEQRQRFIAQAVAREVGELVDDNVRALESLAAVIDSADPGRLERIRPLVASLRRRYPDLAFVYIADASGVSIIADPANGPDGRPTAGTDYSDRDYYRDARSTGVTVVSQVQQGKRTGVPNVHVAVPVMGPSGMVAVVVGSLDLRAIVTIAGRVTAEARSTDIVVTGSDQRVLAHPDTTARAQMRSLRGIALYDPPTTEGAQSRVGSNELGEQRLATVARVDVREVGWLVAATTPISAVNANGAAARRATLWTAGATFLAGLVFAAVAAGWIARPIRRLARMAGRLEGGGPATELAPQRFVPREFSALSQSIATMIARLEAHADELQRTVELRTAELRESNLEMEGSLRELKQARRRLIEGDRLAAVGTLAAGVAHEINNPLAAISLNLANVHEALRGRPPSDLTDLLEQVGDAIQSATRVGKIVRELNLFARPGEEGLAALDVRQTLEAAINLTGNQLRHRAEVTRSLGPVPRVMANESRLGQVFINLLVNAAQAIPEGAAGRNEIAVSASTDSEGRAVIEVRDTGVGIAPENLSRIFDPFFTTKGIGQGTGLGLSISLGIVKALGGSMLVDSQLGSGTTFRVVLPAVEEELPAAVTPVAATREGRRGRVLVVDDDLIVARALRRILERRNEVVLMTSAKEALTLLQSGAAFDVIFCDVMMPEMTGAALHAEVLRSRPSQAARMVFVTAGAFTPEAQQFLERVPYVDKPFDLAKLRALVAEMINRADSTSLEPPRDATAHTPT